MTDPAMRDVPAGWYDDPASAVHVRWWNGMAWTEHIAEKPSPDLQAAAAAAAQRDAAAQQQAEAAAAAASAERVADRIAEARRMEIEYGIGTDETRVVGHPGSGPWKDYAASLRTSTGSVWLIALSPLLTLTLALAAGYVYLFFYPDLLVFAAVGLAPFLTFFWAIRDAYVLRRRGYRAASSAFALLGGFIYLIARGVRVRSGGPMTVFVLLAALVIGGPIAAWQTGIATPTVTAIQIQDQLSRELVATGAATSITCPLFFDSLGVDTSYTCDAVLPDGTEREVWVVVDGRDGSFSYAFALS